MSHRAVSFDQQATSLIREGLVWDNVWPLEPEQGNDFDKLEVFRAAGWSVLSLTVAGDNHLPGEAFVRVASARRAIEARSATCLLIESFEDIDKARRSGRLGVTLHFEGARAFGRNIELVKAFRLLGVTHNLLAFNNANSAAGGCMESSDGGLTAWGRRLVKEMERVNMLVDLSHTGRRSSLEALALATKPMLFSHSNVDAVAPHPRNLTDEQILACASTGGLIGLSGSSGYLGDLDASTDSMFRHLDHLLRLVGEDHVGLGLDIVFDHESLNDWVRGRPDEWPMARDPAWPGFRYAKPQQLQELALKVLVAGYSATTVAKFLGGNYLRLMEKVLA